MLDNAMDANPSTEQVVHELKDVFTALLGLCESVAANLPADSPARDDAAHIATLAAHGAGLIDLLSHTGHPQPAEGTETILVVEDEASVRSVVSRALASCGYTVLEAENGEAALHVAALHNAPIHLVITDVVMPAMSGTDLFDNLRRWYPTMRVLFISGHAKSAIPAEALQGGTGVRFLAKPFTVEQLNAEVRHMLDARIAGS